MRLWQKTSIICIVVIVLAVSTCSGILLVHSKNTILEITHKQAKSKQHDLMASFSEMANYYISYNDDSIIQNTIINYCFSRFADSTSVLVQDDNTLYSRVNIDPNEYIAFQDEDYSEQIYEGEIDGRNILIVGNKATIAGVEYKIFVVEDITAVYNSIVGILWTFIFVSLTGILISTALVVFLMKRSTRSVTELARAARRIADGEYNMRAEIVTKDEIGELASDFNTMAHAVETHIAELTETAERQRLFISGVTHEFKTPLTALLLHSHMLRRAYMSDEERDKSLEHIETQCAWLERLTQTLLKLITLNQGIDTEDVRTSELLERVVRSTENLLADRRVTLLTSCKTDTLHINIDLMQSLLINLVDNASKSYDASSSQREVYLIVYKNAIEVRDNGRGIPASELERIFEPFYMIDKSRSKKSGGSGLGLALVKRIAEAHNADINVKSAVGKGTAITITFNITK